MLNRKSSGQGGNHGGAHKHLTAFFVVVVLVAVSIAYLNRKGGRNKHKEGGQAEAGTPEKTRKRGEQGGAGRGGKPAVDTKKPESGKEKKQGQHRRKPRWAVRVGVERASTSNRKQYQFCFPPNREQAEVSPAGLFWCLQNGG